MAAGYLVVVSEPDPVASAVAARWGTPESVGASVDGVPIRALAPGVGMVKRATLHVHDERLDERLPSVVRDVGPTLVFPSIHRSEQNIECLTVHPLGNPGPSAEVGGRPRTLVPTDPGRMVDALRRLAELARGSGRVVTYEATHHGPQLGLPAFFVEIGYGSAPRPAADAVAMLAEVLPRLSVDPADRPAVAIGGGHYAPHFTDLARKRRWAFGHILSRHALEVVDPATARAAWALTPGAIGAVYARAEDARRTVLSGLGPRAREADAPRRDERATVTSASRSASGT
jgi:D-tyrosyl-tRNA(Tyr) deacylase